MAAIVPRLVRNRSRSMATARLGAKPFMHDPKLARRLRRVTCPTLVVWGDRDPLLPLAYAEAWARLMQAEMAQGKPLEEVADPTSFEADTPYGMSGATYGLAVWTLTETWKYGEALRRWHNKDHGVDPDQPGVVNPAILVISLKQDAPEAAA